MSNDGPKHTGKEYIHTAAGTLRTAIAYHEAGHAVAAWGQGLKVREATIVPTEDYRGSVVHENPLRGLNFDGSLRAENRTNKKVIICLAGPIAQVRYDRRFLRDPNSGFDHDYELARGLALRLTPNAEMADFYLNHMWRKAETLVAKDWDFVVALAGRLLQRGTLGEDEITETFADVVRDRAGS